MLGVESVGILSTSKTDEGKRRIRTKIGGDSKTKRREKENGGTN
jgi:hypothetical protein